jgi:hypothetical protein
MWYVVCGYVVCGLLALEVEALTGWGTLTGLGPRVGETLTDVGA